MAKPVTKMMNASQDRPVAMPQYSSCVLRGSCVREMVRQALMPKKAMTIGTRPGPPEGRKPDVLIPKTGSSLIMPPVAERTGMKMQRATKTKMPAWAGGAPR